MPSNNVDLYVSSSLFSRPVSLFLGIALLIIGIEIIAVGWTGKRMRLMPTGVRKWLQFGNTGTSGGTSIALNC